MKRIPAAVLIIIGVILGNFSWATGSDFSFRKMWPELGNPWYLVWPGQIMVDTDDNVYVTDGDTGLIHKFTPDGDLITQWAAKYVSPGGIAMDSTGAIYVSGTLHGRIMKYNANGVLITEWGAIGDQPGQMHVPQGITIDAQDMIYVADQHNNRIQKFDTNGNYLSEWGTLGTGPGQFGQPNDVVADAAGNIYVADTYNNRVQKFTSDGVFLSQWTITNSNNGLKGYPEGIGINSSGNVVVADSGNSRIQTFTPDGVLISEIGSQGNSDNFLYRPADVAFSSTGSIYVADNDFRIEKFKPNGELESKWGSDGQIPGMFRDPEGIAVGPSGNIYVSDSSNERIQVFSSQGKFLFEWAHDSTTGSIAIDASGNVYVSSNSSHNIRKYTSDGIFLTGWGGWGTSQGQFMSIGDIAIDTFGNVYVADSMNQRIQKFSPDGDFLLAFGKQQTGDGVFSQVYTVAVGPTGIIYAGGPGNCIQTFEPDGTFISDWGAGVGMSCDPQDMVFDDMGNLFILDWVEDTITHLTPDGTVLSNWGQPGSGPGQFRHPLSMAVHPNGDLYVTDSHNNRVQVFSQYIPKYASKAVIVAGGGDYPGNNLWEATQECAGQAFRFLQLQGYTKETIQYLTSDTDVDLDGNGLPDDADGEATNQDLESAVLSWASDSAELILYLTDHGGDGTFKMGKQEFLEAKDLNDWLDDFQEYTGANVIIVYDACQSGSFLKPLASNKYDRVFIASASEDQSAHFASSGQISFSNFFWTEILNGEDLHDAFLSSADAIESVFPSQTPLLNANGDAFANRKEDMALVKKVAIGEGLVLGSDVPEIESVSAPVTLYSGTQAVIRAENVTDVNGISKVWAIITPPAAGSKDPSQPGLDFPELELVKTQDGSYEAVYNDFTEQGVYDISVFAKDAKGILSLPRNTSVFQASGPGYAVLDSSDFQLTIPCIQHQGGCYSLVLDNVPDISGNASAYWEPNMDAISDNPFCAGDCAEMDQDYLISIPKIKFGKGVYEADFEKTGHPQNPFGLSFKLIKASDKKL